MKDLNLVIYSGYIVSKIVFKFVYNSKKYYSYSECYVENKKKKAFIKIYAYNVLADNLYKNYEQGKFITITGKLVKSAVELNEIYEF